MDQSLEKLQQAIAGAHAEILMGKGAEGIHSIQQLNNQIEEVKNGLDHLSSRYASQNSIQVQELLVKGELQVVQLEQTVRELQVFATPEGKQVLQVKKEVTDLLNEAQKNPKKALENLAAAQTQLNAVGRLQNPSLKRELAGIQKRLGYQARRQLGLTESEAKLFKEYQASQTILGTAPIKPGERNLNRYQMIVSKAYVLRFIAGEEGSEKVWGHLQKLAAESGIYEQISHFTTLHKGHDLHLKPEEMKKTTAGGLVKKMQQMSKVCLKNLHKLHADKNDLIQNPSDDRRVRLEREIKQKLEATTGELEKYEEAIAFLSAKGKHRKQLHRLELERAEILASIATMQANRTALREASTAVLNAILGLEQHKVLQEIFFSLKNLRRNTGVQADAGDKIKEARVVLERFVEKRGVQYSLVATLQKEFAQIAADSLSSKSGSNKLLLSAVRVTSTEERAFKRFTSVLSVQIEAYRFAVQQAKEEIEKNILRMEGAIQANPTLKNDAEVQRLLKEYKKMKQDRDILPPRPQPAPRPARPGPPPQVKGPPPRPSPFN